MNDEFETVGLAFLLVRKARLKYLNKRFKRFTQNIIDDYFQYVRIENYLFQRLAEIHAHETLHQLTTRKFNPYANL